MSGGYFDYKQYHIGEIADSVDSLIRNNGKPKNKEDLYPWETENLNYYKYPDDIVDKFKEGLKALRIANIYAQRIDWLLSGDDGEESFLERLEEDLSKLTN